MRGLPSRYLAALLLAVGLSACGKKEAPPPPPPPAGPTINPKAMAVSVDGQVITWGDVLGEMQRLRAGATGQVTAQQAANNLIIRQLLQQAAGKAALPVTAQELADAIATVRKRLPTNTTLEATLRSNGIKEEAFRADLINTIKVNHLLRRLRQKVTTATDVEINQFVKENPTLLHIPESVKARVILVATRPADDAATRKTKQSRAESLRRQVLGGADFAKLAATASDDPSRTQGGELPTLQRGMLPDKVLETAAFSQKPGELGPVLDTRFGYVLLQVQRRTPAKDLQLADVKEKVRAIVTERKYQRVLQDYVNDLRAKAKIAYAETK
jgi:parvulin-like peptidyl-prolyl isomerase